MTKPAPYTRQPAAIPQPALPAPAELYIGLSGPDVKPGTYLVRTREQLPALLAKYQDLPGYTLSSPHLAGVCPAKRVAIPVGEIPETGQILNRVGSAARPVVCITDGRYYATAKQAGSAHKMTAESVRASIREGVAKKGFAFRLAEVEEVMSNQKTK